MTARQSETRVSRFGGFTFLLDAPVPRRSCRINRERPASPRNHADHLGICQTMSTLL